MIKRRGEQVRDSGIRRSIWLILLLLSAAACSERGGRNMMNSSEDLSMTLRRAAGSDLVDSAAAVSIAQTLFQKELGPERLKRQLPLQVSDLGTAWLVRGTPNMVDPGITPTGLTDIATEIVISKVDCRVLKFVTNAKFGDIKE
jgi:hypothetical protein